MRLHKKVIIGWLALISAVAGITFVSLLIYGTAAPYYRGARSIHYYNSQGEVNKGFGLDLLKNGLTPSANVLLSQYVAWLSQPTSGYSLDSFIGDLFAEDVPTVQKAPPAVAAMALIGPDGRTIATYPADLIKRIPSFDVKSTDTWTNTLMNALTPDAKRYVDHPEMYPVEESGKNVAGLLVLWNPTHYAVVPPGARVILDVSLFNLAMLAGISLLCHIILLPIWVGMDAGWRGMRPFAWGALVFVTGWIGLLGYLFARLAPPIPCPNCGEQVYEKFKRCPVCGISLYGKCPVCRTKFKPGWQRCPVCGDEVAEEEPAEALDTIWVPSQEEPTTMLQSPAALTVTALDADTGGPCPNANVSIQGPSIIDGITNNKGVFEARKLDPGRYSVSVVRLGSESAKADIDIAADSSESVEIKLKAQPGKILGKLLDAAREPISGARVFVDSSRIDKSATTDSDGAYELTDIPAGPYTVVAEADGFQPQAKLLKVALGRQVPAEFVLERAAEPVDSQGDAS